MSTPGGPLPSFESSRRNLMRVGAIAASALLAKATTAVAEENREWWRFMDWERDRHRDRDRDDDDDRKHRHCFLRGTTIRAVDGDRKIEELAVGDVLPTVFGGTRPIQWIGRYHFKKSDPEKAWVRSVVPVRIARSALGPNIPHADLYVSEAHGLLIDGVLVAAGNLVNDTTITRYDARELDELEYFHIKLEGHDVIYAEGAPSETLLEVDENAVNFAEYFRRYGPAPADETPCAPLLRYEYRKGEIKSCLRSAIAPWVDRRQPVDIIRDKLDARGIVLLRQPELVF
jgi:Hint domain